MTGHGWRPVVLAALLMAASCSRAEAPVAAGAGSTSASPAATAAPEEPDPVRVSRVLEPAPSDCAGPAPTLERVSKNFGKVTGGHPLWAGIYGGYHRPTNRFRAADAPRTRHGWRIKILWLMHPRARAPSRVSGVNTATGEPVLFDVEASGRPTPRAVFDPREPGAPRQNGRWGEWPSYAFFPRAGCYELKARSPEGRWKLGFGFGGRG